MGKREAHLPGRLPQVLGAVLVSVVLGQVRRRVPVFVPQGVVHTVRDQGLAALWGTARATRGLTPVPVALTSTRGGQVPCTRSPCPSPRWETEAADGRGPAQGPAALLCRWGLSP